MKNNIVKFSLLSIILCCCIKSAAQNDMVMKRIEAKDGKHCIEMAVINYGARIQALKFDDMDVVLGFDTLAHYESVKQNFGAVVGRYIGRILGGNLDIDGQHYQLQVGSNGDCSHGGTPGFSQRYWQFTEATDNSITLRYVSEDGENGFPGELTIDVKYTVMSHSLRIDYTATTTKTTVLNPSNHSFFNLSGDLGGNVLDEVLTIYSDSIALYDENKRVTGSLGSVTKTPFDFRRPCAIGQRIDDDNDQLKVTKGYDHCYQLSDTPDADGLQLAARLTDRKTNICMTVRTTEPAMQIYTANGHKGNIIGKDGKVYPCRNAICFETMHFPDSPNKPLWPSTVLRPGEVFSSTTVFEWDYVK